MRWLALLLILLLVPSVIATSVTVDVFGTNASNAQSNLTKTGTNTYQVVQWIVGDATKSLKADINGNASDDITFTLHNFTAGRVIEVKVNSSSYNAYRADSTGTISFTRTQTVMNQTYSFTPAVNAGGYNFTWGWFMNIVAPNTCDASYCIAIKGNIISATNGSTGAVDYSGTNADTVLDNTYSAVLNNSGGKIALAAKTQLTGISLNVTGVIPFTLELNNGKLTGDGVNPVIRIQTHPAGYYYPSVFGGYVDGNGAEGIRIIDSYHVHLENLEVVNSSVGIQSIIQDNWTESLTFRNIVVRNSSVGLGFNNTGSPNASFGQAEITNYNSGWQTNTSIYIGYNSSLYRSIIEGMAWIPANGTGIYIDKDATASKIFMKVESSAAVTGDNTRGIKIGDNVTYLQMGLRCYGNFPCVDNQYGKKFLWEFDTIDNRVNSTVYTEAFQIKYENGTQMFGIVSNAAGSPIININSSTLAFWDLGSAARANISVRKISNTGNISYNSAASHPSCITMYSPDGTAYKFQLANGGTTDIVAGSCT